MSDDAAFAPQPEEAQHCASHVAQLRPRNARLLMAIDVLLRNPVLAMPEALDSACDYFLAFGARELRERIVGLLLDASEVAAHFVLAAVHAAALNGDATPVAEYLDAALAAQCGFGSLEFVQRVQHALVAHQRGVAELVGTSMLITRVRARLWTLCFGDDLALLERFELTLRSRHVLVLGESGAGHELATAVVVASSLGGELTVVPEVTALSAGRQSQLASQLARAESLPRIVAATTQSLPAMVSAGRFEHALFVRLSAHHVILPSLRERPSDIALLGTRLAEQLLDGSVLSRRPLLRSLAAWLEAKRDERWSDNLPELAAAVRGFLARHAPSER